MSRGRHAATKTWKRRVPIVVIIVFALIALAMGGSAYAAYRYDRDNADRVLPGVAIQGVQVGGMSREQATTVVTGVVDEWLSQRLKMDAGHERFKVTPAELGLRADVAPAVDEALAVADGYSWMDRAFRRLQGKPVGVAIDIDFHYAKEDASEFVKKAARSVLRDPVDASVVIADDGTVVFTRSQPGRELDPGASLRNIRQALNQHETSVDLPLREVDPDVPNRELGKTIVVDLSKNTLTLFDGFKVEKRYDVATAAPGFKTPKGTWHVVSKAKDPTWVNPAPNGWGAGEPAEIPPGPGNPLGTRALYLDAEGIRIHGTYASDSIGTYASHGCIRMLIPDSEDLYPRVPVGTQVLIVA